MGAPISSEEQILKIFDRYFPIQSGTVLCGRGDDCAILAPDGATAITCDIFAEDAHFRRRYFSAGDIGYKALAVNLSDLASSGATPTGFILALSLSGREDQAWLHEFARSMGQLAEHHKITLVGGDLTLTASLHISITAWGKPFPALPRGLLRGQAVPGDLVFVIGALGLARAGLHILEAAITEEQILSAKQKWPKACAQHLRPEPLISQGLALAGLAQKHPQSRIGLMDLSDGLAGDLPRLLNSAATGYGAVIQIQESMLPEEIIAYTRENSLSPAEFAYKGGEDYALAGTCSPEMWPHINEILPEAYSIGSVCAGPSLVNGRAWTACGFDHFKLTKALP